MLLPNQTPKVLYKFQVSTQNPPKGTEKKKEINLTQNTKKSQQRSYSQD